VSVSQGFVNNKLYEIIYPAKNPTVMALGHAHQRRDFRVVSCDIRCRTMSALPTPLGPGIRRHLTPTAARKTAGYLRDFIYLGF